MKMSVLILICICDLLKKILSENAKFGFDDSSELTAVKILKKNNYLMETRRLIN